MKFTGTEIRELFLDFFASKGHLRVPSSSLVPRNDPTVLLTTAGMQQMIPYFLGRETPPANRLYPTVHPEDDEAPRWWSEIAGYPDEAITRLEDNWWGPPGASGPCGPDSEIYYDRGEEHGCGRADCKPGCECERFLEIWNLVFMQYYQDLEGKRTPLPKKNIDTGMGLERLTMVVQGKESVFDTDIFRSIIDRFAALANTRYGVNPQHDTSLG